MTMLARTAWPLIALLAWSGCGSKADTEATAVTTAGTPATATQAGAPPAAGSGGAGGRSAAKGSMSRPAATSGSAAGAGPAPAMSSAAASAGRAASAGMSSMAMLPTTEAGRAAAADSCTRESLRAQVEQYFSALAAHDPTMLPRAPGLKLTENAMPIQLGEGLVWKTAGAVKFTRSLYDTERCGTVTEAVVPNSGVDTIYGLRLQLVEHKLSEIESIVVDPKSGFAVEPDGILSSKAEVWEDVLPSEKRSTRDVLEAAGTAYFAWFSDSSVHPPFDTPCDRLENGTKTTQGTCDNLGGAMGIKHPAQRYPLSDLEAGLTAGFVLFAGADIDFHMFKVVSGKIQRINAVVGPAVRSAGW